MHTNSTNPSQVFEAGDIVTVTDLWKQDINSGFEEGDIGVMLMDNNRSTNLLFHSHRSDYGWYMNLNQLKLFCEYVRKKVDIGTKPVCDTCPKQLSCLGLKETIGNKLK